METPQKQSLAVPIAIVLAGALVGAGIYMSGRPAAPASVQVSNDQARQIDVPAVTSADNIIGTTAADIVLVEYSDTECPFCKNFHQTLKTLQGEYGATGDMAWVYRHFPIAQLHSKAPREAEATQCAADQGKFWPFIDKVFETTPSNDGLADADLPKIAGQVGMDVAAFSACLSSGKHRAAVAASIAEAQKLGANGTPTSFLLLKKALSEDTVEDIMYVFAQYRQPDGSLLGGVSKDRKTVVVSGALPYDFVKGLIEIILKA